MTNNRRAKRDARARMTETGEPYVEALRHTSNDALQSDLVVPLGLPSFGDGQPRRFVDDKCANCMKPLDEMITGLFCNGLCRQIARAVRYWRRTLRDGRLTHADVRDAISMKLAHVLAGGYDGDARRLTPQIREQVRENDHDRCRVCGGPGAEIDHIAGNSPDPSNLQLLCKDCHRTKTNAQMRPASTSEIAAIDQLERERVTPIEPVLMCDDEEAWQAIEPKLRRARRQRLLEQLEMSGYDPDDFRGASREEICEAILDDDDDDDSARGIDDDSGFGSDSYYAHAMAKDD